MATNNSHRFPAAPDLDQFRRLARELQRRANAGVTSARDEIAQHVRLPANADVPLHLAQLALARRYGLRSWPRLVAQVRAVRQLSRDPLAEPDPGADDPADEFLRHAVLVYGPGDGPDRWRHAQKLLAQHPGLPDTSVSVAAAVGDRAALARQLSVDPAAARRPGGPFGWSPLLYLAYSRFDPEPDGDELAAMVELLLAAGADPNDGYLWQGAPTPFTVLTGLFGCGEQGPRAQPPHPQAGRLAGILLRAGADPNDGQTLYNRMFEHADDHLELLFAYGLGTGDGGPWRRRLPDLLDSPVDLLRAQLSWAVAHGMTDRIRLLARHGVDLDSPLTGTGLPVATPLTPVQLGQQTGQTGVVDLLHELGASTATRDAESELIAALLRGDRAEAQRQRDADPGVLERLRRRHTSLVLRATVAGSAVGVRLLVEEGFEVNAPGRADVPLEEPWQTALHHAAGEGDTAMVETLLGLGADPSVRDRRFAATPLDWARHFEHAEVADRLAAVTPS